MKFLTLFVTLILLVMPAAPLWAEEASDPTFALTLGEYNRVNPKQSNLYTRGSRLTGGRVFDAHDRTIGDLDDIIIDNSGNIKALQSSLNRLPHGGADLSLDYSSLNIAPTNGGYKLNQTETQLADMMPQLLSSIATAAGPGSGALSVKDLIGASVQSEKGARIGKIEDVIFEQSGAHVYALLIRVNYKSVAGKSISVPMEAAQYEQQGRSLNVVLSGEKTQTLVDFAK